MKIKDVGYISSSLYTSSVSSCDIVSVAILQLEINRENRENREGRGRGRGAGSGKRVEGRG